MLRSLLIVGFISFIAFKNNQKEKGYKIEKDLQTDSAMVVSAHPLASEIGVDILKKGGNAIDAAIAVQFALAVVYPQAGNIGGGGFMVYRSEKGEVHTLDYREKAPIGASKDMYLDKNGDVTDKSVLGHLAAGVPGSVAGMHEAFSKFSKLKNWYALIEPSIKLAQNGYVITKREADNLNEERDNFRKVNKFLPLFANRTWAQGDVLIQKELAKTLMLIQKHGKDGFYKGKTADYIIKDMLNNGGIITHKDLESYEAIWRKPIKFNYRNHTIYSMGPPSSGGIIMQQIMKAIEPYHLSKMGFHHPSTIHLIVEAERRAYADRATHLGDADFYNVPIKMLTDSNYILKRMKNFNVSKASISDSIKAGYAQLENDHTTHLSIVDSYGNAVAVTTTLNGSYGSFAVVKHAGFILNNEMDDFSAKPGVPNLYGLIGAEANKIESGKRMLSAMTPTIVEKDGKLKMVVGSPGGSTIITSVVQNLINVIDYNMSAYEAVAAPRFHHQWKPDAIQIEDNCFTPETIRKLESMGHKIKIRTKIGRVESIVINKNNVLHGGADVRGDDDVEGF